jgi:hypothetical protein
VVVIAVGRDPPALLVLVPFHFPDPGLKDRVVVEFEVVADPLCVLIDLRRVGVLFLRHVAGFLQQREIAVGFDVALGAGVTVPIPGAAEVAPGLDDFEVGNAALLQPGGGHETGEAGADDGHLDVEGKRLAFEIRLHVGIVVRVVGELGRCFHILIFAVFAEAPIPLPPVLGPQCFRIEVQIGKEVVQALTLSAHRLLLVT